MNSYLPPFLTGLKSNGVSIEKYIKRSYIKNLDLFNPNGHIPIVLLNELMESIQKDCGVDSMAVEFNEYFRSTLMGRVSRHIFQSPNFLTFLEEVIRYSKVIRSDYTVALNIVGSQSKFSVKINDVQSKGKRISEDIDIARILDAFVLVGGPSYTPIELGITAPNSYSLESIFPKGHYTIKTNQAESWILFETSLFSMKVPSLLDSTAIEPLVNSSNISSFKIEKLLESFRTGMIPTLDELALLFKTSRRTLERNLHDEGTNYLRIKQSYLQRKSLELLSNQNCTIQEISEQLDYLHCQNFIRSFKKWTGSTPDEYRSQLL